MARTRHALLGVLTALTVCPLLGCTPADRSAASAPTEQMSAATSSPRNRLLARSWSGPASSEVGSRACIAS
ncbi:hypothetical protein ACFQ7B_41575 [Streptomyces erythrochromogenes]|uniref:hypothetical protein n=1 Tax=Streptomyces erythrochromogenes TaxID=285574 RepID=UPI0036D0EEC9